jgi:hypothetical protein
MTIERDPRTRTVLSWLREDTHENAERVLLLALDEVDATPQRRSLWPSRRSLTVMKPLPLAIGAAAVLVVAAALVALAPRNAPIGNVNPTPTPSSAAARPMPAISEFLLAPGSWSLRDFPIEVSFEVGDRWIVCTSSTVEPSICQLAQEGEASALVIFSFVENIVAEPCGGDTLRNPPVGPSVADLVTALEGLDGFAASSPRAISIDGHAGQELTLTAAAPGTCEPKLWATAEEIARLSSGQAAVIDVIDVNGTRLVINGTYDAASGSAAANLAAVRAVLDSVRIGAVRDVPPASSSAPSGGSS